jgi:signal transduction histidine kinase
MTVAEAALNPDVRSPLQHVVVAGGAMLTLAWRRSFPLAVAAAVMTTNLLLNPEGEFSTLLSLVLVSFTIGAETAPPRSHVGLAVVVVPFVAASVAEGLEPSDLGAALVFLVGPWAVGGLLRRRTIRTDEALAELDRLAREKEVEAARAAEQERTRIARELHDIVSHSISVISIQTQAVRRRLGPEHAAEAADLAAVETTAREALGEMRRLFGVLRSDGEPVSLEPQPGLAELGRLMDQVRTAGFDVSLVTEGDAYGLPPGVDLAAYRIVQESLTNALRHSGGRRVDVRVEYTPTSLRLSVNDDGAGPDAERRTADGYGLVGISERVTLYGGTVEVTPSPLGGLRLVAELPVREGS